MKLNKVADASQDEREASFKFIEKVQNCSAVWDILSVVYKHIKNKQTNKKLSSYGTKWVSSKPFYFSTAFCFFSFLFLTALLLYYVGHVANYPRPVLWFDPAKFDVRKNKFANFFKFANSSLPN